jgi:hypothetical protein
MRLPGPVVALLLAGVALALPAAEAAPRPRPPKAAKTAGADDAARAARQRILREALLDHFVVGVDASREWHAEVRQQNGARFDFWNSYMSGGVGHGEPWFFKYSNFPEVRANDCRALGLGAWYTWYMLSQSAPADYKPGPAQAAPVNARVAATMK